MIAPQTENNRMDYAQTEKHTVSQQADVGLAQMTTWNDLLYPGNATDFFSRRLFLPFDPTTGAYRTANAIWLAELSRLVYRHDKEEAPFPPLPTRTDFLATAGFKQRQFFFSPETDTQAMLVEFDTSTHYAVLAFRGTEQHVKDFITDLTIGKFSIGGSKRDVHDGFKSALDSVWDEIERALRRLNCPVFFTGHSLGAALATLAAARHAPTALYTFGSPRVGDATFAASLHDIRDIIHRVVDEEDIVADLPPTELGFQHVGKPITLTTTNNLPWLKSLFKLPQFLADHAPVNYVDRL